MKNITFKMIFLLVALSGWNFAMAQMKAPHTLRGESDMATVSLSWKSPTSPQTLQWHHDRDYDGETGISMSGKMPEIYVANLFTKEDLKGYKDAVIDSVAYFHYRPVFSITIQLYENGEVVYEQPVDTKSLELNKMASVKLDKPYTIKTDVDLMIAVKFLHGENLDFVAIMDNGPVVTGKGDLYSYDGVNWKSVGRGNFLVTGHIQGTVATEEPDGYNVYRGDAKVNTELLEATEVHFSDEPVGTFDYHVTAVYGDKEERSNTVTLTNKSATDYRPVVTNVGVQVEGMKVTTTWNTPFSGNELTWSSKEILGGMKGTGTKPKLWIVHAFDAKELLAYNNHQITAINVGFYEAKVDSLWMVIFADGKIAYTERVEDAVLSQIKANSWMKFTLKTPYQIPLGSDLRFGYLVYTPEGVSPAGRDGGPQVPSRGGWFSTSSPATSGLENTKPTWKELLDGGYDYNWTLSADVEPVGEGGNKIEAQSYDVYRDGQKVAEAVTVNSYVDEVPSPGTYEYGIVAHFKDGKESEMSATVKAKVALPAEYVSPMFLEKSFSEGNLSLSWSTDVRELKHYNEVVYSYGLQDTKDIDAYFGASFTPEEVNAINGYTITGVNMGLADTVKKLEVFLYIDDQVVASKVVDAAAFPLLEMNVVKFDTPVAVPEGKTVLVAYHIVYEVGKSPTLLDDGPLVEGGALISFEGTRWSNLGLISTVVKNNNIVIGLVAEPKEEPASYVLSKFSSAPILIRQIMNDKLSDLSEALTPFALESDAQTTSTLANKAGIFKAETTTPKVKSYRLYCNGSLVEELDGTSYSVKGLPYGAYSYAVSAVYDNGWESALSDSYDINYQQPNLVSAPYALTGERDGKDLNLTWQSPSEANELTWQDKESTSLAVGLSGKATVEGYFAILYSEEDLKNEGKIGQFITHVKFGLADPGLDACKIVIYFDKNRYYEQEVNVETLIKGENSVRLDTPVELLAGREVMVGYYAKYASTIKPNMTDSGPAEDGKGNMIANSASDAPTSWKTLKKLSSKLDYNWRITAVLQNADVVLKAPAMKAETDTPALTYTVYRNGVMLAENLAVTSYKVSNAADGIYTVTAVIDGVETAPSNAILLGDITGITGVDASSKATYDNSLKQVILPKASTVSLFNTDGVLLKRVYVEDRFDMSGYPAGIYVINIDLESDGTQLLKVVK